LGQAVVDYACQFIGNPYVPGGTSLTEGADCSGFVFSVYKEFGYTVPRTSYSLRSAGTEVAYEDAQPGDIICYPGHVAIYIGNGLIVHASSIKTGIKISNANYRGILAVRRLI
ncbi:MAG: C40 family peptidase, partial [Lachnospiraceae bacterium]